MASQAIHVLLVEDDDGDYFLTSGAINSIGRARYEIVWCQTFEKALDALSRQSFDVALVDYRIGVQTGIEFMVAAKAKGHDVPMILMTGLQDHEIDLAASNAGAADYLNKGELTSALIERSIRFACANATTQRILAQRSGLLQTTLDNTGSGLAALDANGELIAFNKKFVELGCILMPSPGPAAVRLTPGGADESPLDAVIGEMLRGATIDANDRTELRTLDERVLDFAINRTKEGGAVVVVQDITEQRLIEENLTRAKENAEAASQSKTTFLATMSHELRTPLNAIIGFSEVILKGAQTKSRLDNCEEYITYIIESGRHLLEIINEILEFSKAEAGEHTIEKEVLDLRAELDFCSRVMVPHAEKARLDLRSELEGVDRCIYADSTALRRIVINLLSNAIKFTPEGGTVTLSATSPDDETLSICVIDNGIGIRKDDLSLVMQPFYQVRGEINRPYEGTGLGLSIVKSLAQMHDATLKIDSVFGKGTTVVLDFPRQADAVEAPENLDRKIAQ